MLCALDWTNPVWYMASNNRIYSSINVGVATTKYKRLHMAKSEPVKFPKEEYEEMRALWRRILTNNDTDLIYRYYKKYVNAHAVYPINNCNCAISASRYYDTLRDWWSENADKFEQ
jgi:hypothetical protein